MSHALLLGLLALPHADFPTPEKLLQQADFPDPLKMLDGTQVTFRTDWESKRRPELLALFQHYMYGRLPASEPVRATVLFRDEKAYEGKGTLTEVALTIGTAKENPIRVLLALPNGRTGPVPVFVGLNFAGNQAATPHPSVHIPQAWMYPNRAGVKDNRAGESSRGQEAGVWNIPMVLERGYAIALAYNGDIDPDRNDKREGLRPYLASHKSEAPAGAETATVMAWAWGLHRMIDYLVTLEKDIHSKKIICVGHSRLGKTALLAAAFDERIALAIPHQAGCGGTAPSRSKNPKAESVKRINTSFPHWFCGNFKAFNDDPTRLPFDQHALAALVAPRPLLYTNATEDQWANPDGQFDMLQGAEAVYRLYGDHGLSTKTRPEVGKLSAGRLGYWIRDGKHSMTRSDWQVFLDYADRHLGTK